MNKIIRNIGLCAYMLSTIACADPSLETLGNVSSIKQNSHKHIVFCTLRDGNLEGTINGKPYPFLGVIENEIIQHMKLHNQTELKALLLESDSTNAQGQMLSQVAGYLESK